MSTAEAGLLTVEDAWLLGQLVKHVGRGSFVELAVDVKDKEGDFRRFSGTLRHFVTSPDNFGFPGNKVDLRDQYVRVTTETGWETVFSVAGYLEGDTILLHVRENGGMTSPESRRC